MKNCFLTYSIFSSILFFSIISILRVSYLGGESNNSYLYASAMSFLFSIFVVVPYFFKKASRIPHLVVVILVIAGIFILASFEGYIGSRTLNLFTVFSLPNILIGTYLGSQSGLSRITKWLDIVMLIITLGLIMSLDEFLMAMYMGDKGYSQDKSYFACLAFLLNLFLLQFGHKFQRFSFTSNKSYMYICSLLLPVQVLLLLISGGRGGFVALAVGVIFFFHCVRETGVKNTGRFLSIAFGAIIAIIFLGSMLSSHFLELLSNSIDRIFSYISSSGIDLTQTSHRDEVYEVSIKRILERPFLGYGFFSYSEVLGEWPYPHNLFLEWILQGGVFFFIFFFIFLLKQIKKLYANLLMDESLIMLIPLLFYSLSELMFSATYICMPLFWFCMAYLFNYKNTQSR